MRKIFTLLAFSSVALIAIGASAPFIFRGQQTNAQTHRLFRPIQVEAGHEVEIMVNGRPLEEYRARGQSYVEALEGAEYEVRLHNRTAYRVAVALSVDGLNTIDARRTTSWNASKWVIDPYGTITVGGWQMSSERARRFYFTSEHDSYGAKLGRTNDLGLISAVFFRERRPTIISVAPPPNSRPLGGEDRRREAKDKAPSNGASVESSAQRGAAETAPAPDDEYAATGIGRSVHNDVRWVDLDLDANGAAELRIRYEYYPALVRLGIVPHDYEPRNTLKRRERATGFEDRQYSPEP